LSPFSAFGQDEAVVTIIPSAMGMEVGAKAAIVMEARTGRVLFAQNEHEKLPVASTTKIMTALLALEQPDIDAVFEVAPDAIRVEGTSMGLLEGDRASLRTLAAGMLLSSGNDAANVTAVRISGSLPAFSEKMNERARSIGMENTSFITPSGLDAENHYSTAYDMALLARAALNNPDFVDICSQYRMRVSYGNPPYNRWLQNHNRLLSSYDGVFGVKTGFTRKSGRCLVSAAARDGVELIVVTLSCPDDWNTHRGLYDRFFKELTLKNLAADIPEMTIPVAGGTDASVPAVTFEESNIPVLVSGSDIRYEIALPPFVYAPVAEGQYLGEARIFLDGERVSTLSLIAGNQVTLLHEYDGEDSWWELVVDFFT
jgi:D-alanyl-D-alanine carboxypeptidase/D-alanyl-D-alanine carboxypeptidase (penicillin-binding protein 5/6)